MQWEVDDKAAKRLSDIVRAVKGSDKVILATDPDREGEAISWHVLEVLRARKVLKDKPIERVVFNAITKSAVRDAMNNPRAIDQPLVDAYLARRALDYLVGFNLSPFCGGSFRARARPAASNRWPSASSAPANARSRSSGRASIGRSSPTCAPRRSQPSRRGSSAPTAGRSPGSTSAPAKRRTRSARRSRRLGLRSARSRRSPSSATLSRRSELRRSQQDASRKLGLSPARTMQVAQKLYEGVAIKGETAGLITYMRTDGVDMAPEAISGTRRVIADQYGDRYLPKVPRKYTVKAKNAQEAHEAIRPTDPLPAASRRGAVPRWRADASLRS